MRIKNLNYCGKEAISIYIRDRTQAVKEKLYSMKEQEKIQSTIQTENYTSTISHEMRTPILSIIFFLTIIMDNLKSSPVNKTKIQQAIKYCELVMS